MIRGVHTMFYTSEADLGCHPTETGEAGAVPSGTPHISFYCDDLDETMRELRERGVEFVDEVADVGYGRRTSFRAPGDFTIELYQPGYEKG
jgi:predicted enzyme related to lactoylglutathione lyase